MQSLVAALAKSLGDAVTCDARVTTLRRVDAGVAGDASWELEDVRGRRIRAREVVLATPAWHAAPLLAPLAPDLARELASIEAANVAVVAFGVARAQVGADVDGLGFLVPRTEESPLLGILFESSLFPARPRPAALHGRRRTPRAPRRRGRDRRLHLAGGVALPAPHRGA